MPLLLATLREPYEKGKALVVTIFLPPTYVMLHSLSLIRLY
jgi:hypothetical protein